MLLKDGARRVDNWRGIKYQVNSVDLYQIVASWREAALFATLLVFDITSQSIDITLFNSCDNYTIEPPHDKTNKMACAPSEDSDQPGHPPSLIRVFPVYMKEPQVLGYLLSAQWRLIRLGGCQGWSVTLLGAHAMLLVLSWGGLIICYYNYSYNTGRTVDEFRKGHNVIKCFDMLLKATYKLICNRLSFMLLFFFFIICICCKAWDKCTDSCKQWYTKGRHVNFLIHLIKCSKPVNLA